MKVILLQNTIINSRRFLAGESTEVSESIAKQMAEAHLVHIEQQTAQAKEPVKRTARKAVKK